LNAYEVGYTVASTFSGNDQSKFKANGNEYNIMVNADPYDRSTIEDVRKLTFSNSDGQTFTLDQFAIVDEVMGETVLERIDRLPSIKINSAVVGRAVGTVSAEITEQVNKLRLPQGVSWQYIGQVERQQDSFGSLGLALGIGILLVYLIMVALYENAIYPFVVLTALPLATVGAFLALALTMESLTIFSIIGVIMLMGLVAKNGILLVDFANEAREQGMSAVEALIEAGKERFRPILMTTIAMIVGMLPIALASGSGAEVKNGMAWVIIGGLTSSLLLTLVVVPSTYMVVAKAEALINRKKRRKEQEALAHEHAGGNTH
ncbi:MAG: efflux RND transporter permease subunit, partial [Flavobacteriales bacterium]